ncbi:MAG: PAS domain S-box protein [Bacteroidota bacterium]
MNNSEQNKYLKDKVNSLSHQIQELQARLNNTPEKALQERVKELQCLYKIANLSQNNDLSIEEFLQNAVNTIPPSWQYSEITCARIRYNGKTYTTPNFQETPWKLSSDIVYNNKKKGSVEVFYLEEKPTADEGPFLKEERKLIDAVALHLGQYLERKEITIKHQQSEEYLRITLNSIGDGVIATDTSGKITLINPVAEELTGWTFQEARGHPVEEIFVIKNSQTGENVSNPVEKVLKTGKIVGLANHTKLIAKNGNEYQIADSGSPIKDKHNNIIGVVLVFRNVTKEYNIQEKLKISEERFRTIVEGAPEPIFIQIQHNFAFLNPAACKLFGIDSPDELTGTPVIDRFHPDFHEIIKKRIQKLNKAKESISEKFEQKLIRKDGSNVWVETVGEPIKYMGKDGGLVFVRDISQRKKAEEKIRKNEEKYRTLFYETPLGIIHYDNNGVVIDINEKFVEIIGAAQKDILEVDMLNDLTDNDFINAVKSSLLTGKGYYEGNYTSVKGQKTTPIRAIFKGICDSTNTIIAGMALVEDISERKKAEEKLKTLKNNLQAEVKEKTKELQERVAELQRFHDATVEREFRIKELRDEIERLKGEDS